jgi:hypothetical protein
VEPSASVQPFNQFEGLTFVSMENMADEVFAERSGDDTNTTGPINAIESSNLIVASAWDGDSVYEQLGTSGVAAMQLSVVTDRYVIIYDKAEHNPLKTNDGINAWSVLLDTQEHTVRALKLETNSFCAGIDPFVLPTLGSAAKLSSFLRWRMARQWNLGQLRR